MESKGKITITIEKSILTYDACTFSVMDPWFYAFLPESTLKNYKSQVKKDQGKLPIWNETFSFDINKEKMLSIEVCHEKELLGTAEIYIEDIIKKSKYTGQHALLYDGKVRGTIYGTFTYVPSGNIPNNTIQPRQNFIPQNNNVVINPTIINPNNVNPKINPNVVVPSVVIPNNNNFNNINPNFINPNFVVPNVVNPVVPGNTTNYSYPSFDNNLVQGNSSYTHTDFQNNNYNNNFQYNNSGTTTGVNSNKTLNYFKNPLFFQGNSSSVWFFDINSKSWKTYNNFSNEYFPQYMRAAELPDGSFFLSGGDYSGQSLNSASLFANGYTTKKEYMLIGRKAHSTTYAKGSVYVFGGFSYNNAVVNFCEKYDLTSGGGWKQIAQMNVPRAYSTTLVYSDSFIFVIGGFTGQITNGVKYKYKYNDMNSLKKPTSSNNIIFH